MSRNSRITITTALLLAISLLGASANGQESTAKQLQSEAKKYSESMPTGSVPATNILGISDSAVPRATSFQSVVTQFSQGVGPDGKIKNAIGFEMTPYLLANDELDWTKYDNSLVTQILTRTTVSFAAIPAEDTKTASSGVGVQSVFFSSSIEEARKKSHGCLPKHVTAAREIQQYVGELAARDGEDKAREERAALAENRPQRRLSPRVEVKIGESAPVVVKENLTARELAKHEKLTGALADAVSACQRSINTALQAWNASIFAAGLGWGFYSPDNNAGSLRSSSSVYWLTGAIGWGDGTSNTGASGLISLHARKAGDERAPDPANSNAMLQTDSSLYGISLRFGNRKFGGLFEYSHRTTVAAGLTDENVRRNFVGMDFKVAEDLYLSWGVGSETGRRDGIDKTFALANIKYAFGDKPLFSPSSLGIPSQ